MAEGRYRTFAPLQKFPADWPNALAAFTAPLSNLNLAPKSSTTVMAPVDTQPQLSLGVDGLWRYSEVEIDAAVPAGAAQTFDIVATATANSFKAPAKEGEGETDETNYAFALQVVTHNTLPSGGGIAAAQKVGEVDWDGAQITGIRQLVGTLRATDPLSPKMPLTSVPAINATGIAAATVPVARLTAPEAANQVLEVVQGAAAKLRINASGQVEWVGGPVLHAEGSSLVLTGKLSVSEAATLVAGGTSTTPAADDNTTKIATTAYVLGQASNANPLADGELTLPGTSTRWARGDHQHPHDGTKANLNSPGFSGEPTSSNPPLNDNSNRIATTKYVQEAGFAPIAGPVFTGNPGAPTRAFGDNTTGLATTAFVQAAIAPGYSAVTSKTALLTDVAGRTLEARLVENGTRVEFRGEVTSTEEIAEATNLFTMPAGMAPGASRTVPVVGRVGATKEIYLLELTVQNNGVVHVITVGGVPIKKETKICFEGVSFGT